MLCGLGDLNVCVGHNCWTLSSRRNDNSWMVIDFCAERGLSVKKKDILRYVQDVKGVLGMGRGLSDYHIVLFKLSW